MVNESKRKRKTFSNVCLLEGMGVKSQCFIMGTRERLTGQAPRLIRLTITREPAHMLDGLYTVRFGEESAQVERKGGLWLWTLRLLVCN